jgi:hypothetical protein
MALSDSTDWTQTALQVIERAFRKIGQKNPSQPEKVNARTELNSLVKALQGDNIFLWTVEWKTKTFSASDEVTGTDSNVYTCIRGHTSAASNKPVTGADYSTYWVQEGSTGGVWATATAYEAIGDFAPDSDCLDIIDSYVRIDDRDQPVKIIDRFRYMEISDKTQTGRILNLYLQKTLTPHVFLWPQSDNTDDVLHYQQVVKLQDFDKFTNNPDFATHWIEHLVYALAAVLAIETGHDMQSKAELRAIAEDNKRKALSSNRSTVDENMVEGLY